MLLAGLEMAEHFNHTANSLCSKSECRQTSKKEDQPLAINSRSTDKINPPASKSQETRHPTKQSSRNGSWNDGQIYNSRTNTQALTYTRRVKTVGQTQMPLIRARQDIKNSGRTTKGGSLNSGNVQEEI